MDNLLFFRRSCAYRHAARIELQQARMLPRGSERNQALKRARALRDLARDQAWLEGQLHRTLPRRVTPNRVGVTFARAASAPNPQSAD